MSTSHNDVTASSTPPSGGGEEAGSGPLVSQRAATVFLAAVLIGLVCGGLGYISMEDTAAACLCGLGAAGISLGRLHKLIGS